MQLNFFGGLQGTSTRVGQTRKPNAMCDPDDILCWTRMQAESGQLLVNIIGRKELERRAGGGLFFWGVGNAISTPAAYLNADCRVPIVFSKMISHPKLADVEPKSVLVWRKFIEPNGNISDLPSNVLLLSRGDTHKGIKSRHYALVCYSADELEIKPRRPFDPFAYRNVSALGGSVGFSQVTALLRRNAPESRDTKYNVDMQAELIFPYFVRLADPALIQLKDRRAIDHFTTHDEREWVEFVSSIRSAKHR